MHTKTCKIFIYASFGCSISSQYLKVTNTCKHGILMAIKYGGRLCVVVTTFRHMHIEHKVSAICRQSLYGTLRQSALLWKRSLLLHEKSNPTLLAALSTSCSLCCRAWTCWLRALVASAWLAQIACSRSSALLALDSAIATFCVEI
jgi:hypothetical protein